jgi:two-component system, NarL family, response regulator NreC
MTTAILLADDHPVVRQGLRLLLEAEPDFTVVGETGDGLEVLALVQRLLPDVLVLDLMLPGLGGLEVTRRVHRTSPKTQVVILSMHANVAYVAEALAGGAAAYVLKKSTAGELVSAIRAALAGRQFLSVPLSAAQVEQHRRQSGGRLDPYDTLTRREREVLQLVVEGQTSAEIGARLSLSPRTVEMHRRNLEMHRRNLVRKLGLSGQAALVRYGLQRGLGPPPD